MPTQWVSTAMPADELRRDKHFTVVKTHDGWLVASPDKTLVGPYHNAAIALQVAVCEVLLARKQGFGSQILVQDERGGSHPCMLIDRPDDPDRCSDCEKFWPAAPRQLRCPVRAAIDDR